MREMSNENNELHVDVVERQEEMQLVDDQWPTTIWGYPISYEGQQLLDELDAVKINISDDHEEHGSNQRRTIQKVPEIILQNAELKKYVKPKELSIGPIHAADSNLHKKELKLKLASYFIQRSGRTMHALLENIMDYVADIKRSFDEKLIEPYYDEELVRLLFLDGCAMLGFIQSYVNKKLNMFRLSNELASLIQWDLFALENQIPFKVLEVLMGLREKENVNLKHEFCRFIALMSTSPGDFTEFVVMRLVDENPVHILDLLREVLLFDDPIFFHPCGYMLTNLIRTCGCGAAALLCCMMERFNKSLRLPKEKSNITQYSFRNVQELKKAGIDFKPSDSLTTIYFRSPFNISAQLMLPKILVDNSTEHKLLTLVAYEMSVSGSHPNHEPWVTCYVNLLDLLVDNEQDVKDLKAADILQNCLGSDIAAAQLINNMGTKFFPPATDTYEHVKNKVERHCRNKCRRRCALWMTQVCHTHFSSPWTILALFAATAILALTAVQTWYAIHPKK